MVGMFFGLMRLAFWCCTLVAVGIAELIGELRGAQYTGSATYYRRDEEPAAEPAYAFHPDLYAVMADYLAAAEQMQTAHDTALVRITDNREEWYE